MFRGDNMETVTTVQEQSLSRQSDDGGSNENDMPIPKLIIRSVSSLLSPTASQEYTCTPLTPAIMDKNNMVTPVITQFLPAQKKRRPSKGSFKKSGGKTPKTKVKGESVIPNTTSNGTCRTKRSRRTSEGKSVKRPKLHFGNTGMREGSLLKYLCRIPIKNGEPKILDNTNQTIESKTSEYSCFEVKFGSNLADNGEGSTATGSVTTKQELPVCEFGLPSHVTNNVANVSEIEPIRNGNEHLNVNATSSVLESDANVLTFFSDESNILSNSKNKTDHLSKNKQTSESPKRLERQRKHSSGSDSTKKAELTGALGNSSSFHCHFRKQFGHEAANLSFSHISPAQMSHLFQRYLLHVPPSPGLSRPKIQECAEHLTFWSDGFEELSDKHEIVEKRKIIRAKTLEVSRLTVLDNATEELKLITQEISALREDIDYMKRDARCRRENFARIILDAFHLTFPVIASTSNPESENCYWKVFCEFFLSNLPNSSERRTRGKEEDNTEFLKLLVKFFADSYRDYKKNVVKLNHPVIARIFYGRELSIDAKNANAIRNFKDLVKLILTLHEGRKEILILMDFFNMAVEHFASLVHCQHFSKQSLQLKVMLRIIWAKIEESPCWANNFGIPLVSRMELENLGEAICRKVICGAVPQLMSAKATMEKKKFYALLKTITKSSLVLQIVSRQYDPGVRPEDVDKLKGETKFHRACGLRTPFMSKRMELQTSLSTLNKLLDELLCYNPKDAIGDINARDYNGNSCLHDAAANGRIDAIQVLFQRCWQSAEEPSRDNLDILAQDANGNTALHIAINSLQQTLVSNPADPYLDSRINVVKLLVEKAAEAPKKFQILLSTKNNRYETVFSFSVANNETSKEIFSFLAAMDERINRPLPVGILNTNSKEQIQESQALQSIFAHWKFFYDKVQD